MNIPTYIFLVPYRDMEEYLNIYLCMMSWILEKEESWEIYIIEQHDKRPFNRGAMKNAGFKYIKEKYPGDYKNITLIFQDVDTIPTYNNKITFNVKSSHIKHYFGFDFALGGMFAIHGSDFEKTNGFPNYWGYGLEDSRFLERCKEEKLKIDRSEFFNIKKDPKEFIRFPNVHKRASTRNPVRDDLMCKRGNGITDIKNIEYREENIKDRMYHVFCTNWKISESHIQQYKPFDYGSKLIKDTDTNRRRIYNKSNIMNNLLMNEMKKKKRIR